MLFKVFYGLRGWLIFKYKKGLGILNDKIE